MTPKELTLYCLVIGAEGNSFPVDIRDQKTVGHLKKEIKNAMPDTINCEWPKLTLYMAKKGGNKDGEYLVRGDEDITKLSKPNIEQNIADIYLNEEMEMDTMDILGTDWFKEPIDLSKKQIHVLVKLPTPPVINAPSPEEEDVLKIIAKAPSTFGTAWDQTKRCQEAYNTPRITFLDGLPVELYCPVFGEFMCRFRDGYKRREIRPFVEQLIAKMAKKYSNENRRTNIFSNIFKRMLPKKYRDNFNRLERNKAKSDGSLLYEEDGPIILNLEVKNENCCSYNTFMQNIQYFAKFLPDTTSKACQPCFFLQLIGGSMSVACALRTNNPNQVTGELLTPQYELTSSLDYRPEDFEIIWSLFSSLILCIDKLYNFYQKGHHRTVISFRIPSPLLFPEFELQNIKNIIRRVYFASLGDQAVVMKITKRYCYDLHRILAAKKLAPKLINSVQALPNWEIVIMERLHLTLISELNNEDKERYLDDINRQINNILSLMRKNKFVHGDMRPCNVLAVKENGQFCGRIVVIDFDWCGKQGEVFYPPGMNRSCKWPDGCREGNLVEFRHDEILASRLLGDPSESDKEHVDLKPKKKRKRTE